MNTNDLFADDAPMVEGSVEPNHAGSGDAGGFGNFGGQNDFTSPKNDFTSPKNDFTSPKNDFASSSKNDFASSSKNDFASSKNDFVIPQQNEFADPQSNVISSPIDQQRNASQGSQPRSFNSTTQQQPAMDDGFFAPSAPATVSAPAPATVSSPLATAIPSHGSQRNLTTSGPASAATSVTSPGVASSNAAAATKGFVERGRTKLEAQRKAVQERIQAADAATKQKEQDIQKKAADYLAEANKKRSTAIATIKADHLKEQQQHEAKMSQFKKSGAIWNSVNLLVDTKKPNAYSKNTEYMRVLISELKQE